MMVNTLIICFLFSISTAFSTFQFKDCNASQFEFIPHYSLGSLRQLNSTFDMINTELPILPTLSYDFPSGVTYQISKTKASSLYLSSKQTGQIIGEDIIYIKGGSALSTMQFEWSRQKVKGTATVQCKSESISFAKLLYQERGFIRYKLGDYANVTYKDNCSITRIEPLSNETDYEDIYFMVNTAEKALKKQLQTYTAIIFEPALSISLDIERQPIQNNYTYTYRLSSGNNVTVEYTMLPVGCHLQKIGLVLNFVTEITNDQAWKCGNTVPHQPKDIEIYRGEQEFLSLSVWENTVRWAAERSHLDTVLNRQKWQSPLFQFFAGDLYPIFPLLTSRFYASTPVEGQCKAVTTNLKLVKTSNNNLLLSIHYSCSLSINNTKIVEFQVDPNFIVKIEPQQTYLDFVVVELNSLAYFKEIGDYHIEQKELANLFVRRGLETLKGSRVFGSGWLIYPRDYPQVQIEDGVVFIYDGKRHQQ